MEAEKIKIKKNHRINFTILQGPTFLYSLYLTSTFGLLTTQKPLTVWITTNCGKFLRWEYQIVSPAF